MKKEDNFSIDIREDDLIQELRSLPEANAPDDFSQNVMEKIHQQMMPKKKRSFRRYFPLLAACLALVVSLSVLTFKSKLNQKDSSQLIHQGKTLLSQERLDESLPLLKKVVQKFPGNADALFFLGMNYGRLERFDDEQQAYKKALLIKPDNPMTHYFLGHSYMNTAQWKKAVSEYKQVLSLDMAFSKANYNLGLALNLSGRTQEALAAWKKYLEIKKTGEWARLAVSHLNAHGDFTYRSFPMGKQKIIMGPFEPEQNRESIWLSEDSLRQLGKSMKASDELDLFIMVYAKEQHETAKNRAFSIKKMLLKAYPDIHSDRIKVSWFDQEDRITINQESFSLKTSIRFLGIKNDILEKGIKS